MLDFRSHHSHIRQHEEVVVAHGTGEHIVALVGHIHGVELLVDDEVERVGDHRHLLLVILHIVVLGLLEQGLDARLGKVLDERLILRKSLVGTQEELSSLGLVACRYELAGFIEGLVDESPLGLVELLHVRLELEELGFVRLALRHRTGDDERGTGIVDEHGVHLIHDGVVVLALHEVLLGHHHIVAEVIKAELVVGAKGDVALIGLFARLGIWLMLVDAVHRKPVEHIQGPHPLGVSLGEVVVHRDHVHSLAREGVEEYREGGHEGLSLTCRHLGYLSLVQGYTTDELHVVVHHIPLHLVASGNPMVGVYGIVPLYAHEVVVDGELTVEIAGLDSDLRILLETPCGGFHDGESLRKDFRKALLDRLVLILYELVALGCEIFLLRHGDILVEFFLDLGDTLLERLLHLSELHLQGFAAGPEPVIAEFVYFRIYRKYLLKYRLDRLEVSVRLGPEHFSNYRRK